MYKSKALLVLPSVWLAASCQTEEEPPAEVIRPVRYMEVLSTGGGRARVFSGEARADTEARLSFKVGGTVSALPVRVGDQVDKGQLIAELDPSDFELQVEQSRAALIQAQAQERNARAAYERTRTLYESENATKSDLDSARAAAEGGRASVNSAQKQLQLARRQLQYTRLLAPESGSIASVDVEVNENVTAGQEIVMLTAGSNPEVQVSIPEVLISRVNRGQKVEVSFDAIKGRTFAGVVEEVGVATVRGSAAFPATIRLADNPPQLRPGMAAEVTIRFEQGDTESVFVPPFAVRADRGGSIVFVVEAQQDELGIVRRRPVEVGEFSELGLEVTEGLDDGQLLVIAGVSRIQDGQQVRLLPRYQEQ